MSTNRYRELDAYTYEEVLRTLKPANSTVAHNWLPQTGELVFPVINSTLSDLGWMRTGLKTRWIDSKRVGLAIHTGTDRDCRSELYHHGGDDGEYTAMEENGLNLKTDLDLVTYLGRLEGLNDYRMGSLSNALLIYTPEALKGIQPSKNRTGSYSNGFHMFLDRRLRLPSLLAVFQPLPRTTLEILYLGCRTKYLT